MLIIVCNYNELDAWGEIITFNFIAVVEWV